MPILGVNVHLDQYDDHELTSVTARLADGGFVWVRQSFSRSQVEGDGPNDGFDWSSIDRIVNALGRHAQLRLVAVFEDDPPNPPRDPDRFAAFASAFADRYGDRVDHYQIWDEPNLAAHWGGGPVDPFAYADLLVRTAPAIRAADPGARILLAGLAPTTETGPRNLSEVRYLDGIYHAGAASAFDIVAAKPYGFETGPGDRRVDASRLNVSRLLLLREVMVEHGDAGKAIWASHWGWNALPDDWDGAPSIWGQTDELTQAARSVAMLERAREEWPWMGAMIIETLQPERLSTPTSRSDLEDPRWGFSLLAPNGTPRPVYYALADWMQALPAAAPVGGYPARSRWATYEGGWRVGPLQADVGPSSRGHDYQGSALGPTSTGESNGDRVTFRFDGTRVALTVRRGPYPAFLYITVDGEPANELSQDERGRSYVVLYDNSSGLATIPLATGLEPGVHTVEVLAGVGQGQWSLVDWRVGAAPVRDGTSWKLGGLVAVALVILGLLVREARRVRWALLTARFLALPAGRQTGLTAGCVAILWVAASLSWGHLHPPAVLPALCLVLSLTALPVLSLLFALRPDLGLTLVALVSPLYLVPGAMFYAALSLPEVLVLLCLVGHIVAARLDGFGQPADPSLGRYVRRRLGMLTGIDVAILLLFSSALLAGAAAADSLAALFELRSVFLLPGLYYALLRLTPLDDDAWRRIVDGFLLGGASVALVGLGQAAAGRSLVAAEGGVLRLQSVYHSPNSLGLYLGRAWPFLAAGAVWGRARCRRAFSVLALAVVTLALVLSFSRGALLLALPASVLAMGWRVGGRYRWAALALIAVGMLALIPFLSSPRFAGLLDLGRGTTFFRLKLWRSSLHMIRDHPLLGVGPGNFLRAYRSHYILPSAWEEFNLEHAHNILLDHWTRLGVLGVAAGVALQIAFWRTLGWGKRPTPLRLGLTGSMAALLAHGLVDNAIFFPDLALTFFMMLALAQAVPGTTAHERSAEKV